MKSRIYKSILLSMSIVTLFSGSISETLTVDAATEITSSDSNSNEIDELLNQLPENKQTEFQAFVSEYNISPSDQISWLNDAIQFQNTPSPRWKGWLAKQAIKLALKRAGKSASDVWIAKQVLKFNGTVQSFKMGLTDSLVSLGVNRKVGSGIVSGVSFIVF